MRPPQISVPEIEKSIQFHSGLNKKLWDSANDMRVEVRIQLLRCAFQFIKFLDIPSLRLSDIVITGSNAAYNYTKMSDIDLHLIVDYEKSVCPELAPNFFNTKKSLWNDNHHISIKGLPVEIYIENTEEPAFSNGLYSVLRGAWLRKPTLDRPKFDDAALIAKTNDLADQIEALASQNPTEDQLTRFRDKLRNFRKAGLSKGGEFSTENLAFKALRALGYLDLLANLTADRIDRDLSIPEARQE